MDYPVVFDKTARSFMGAGLAVLHNAYNVKIRQVINGEYTLSLVLPWTDESRKYIEEENFIVVGGQAFRIRTLHDIRDSVGALVSNIQCEHVSYDLNDVRHLPRMNDIINVSLNEVFNTGFSDGKNTYSGILQGTGFTLDTQVMERTDLYLYKTSPRAVLNHFLEELECEAVFDNFHITVVPKRGQTGGVQFRVGKNLENIKRTIDSTTLITRLYPYGADYLDITSVNSGKAYIDSPLINLYDYVHEGYLDFSNIDQPQALMDEAAKKWSTEEEDGIDKPKVTYEVSVVELCKIDEFAQFEKFELGDTVRVIDEQLGIDVNARIMEYEYYPYEPQKSSVVLANFKENIGGVFAELLKAKNLVENIVTNKGQINDEYIESVRQTMQMKFNQSLSKKAVIHEYADIWVDDVNNPSAAIALVDGMFALANKKKPDGTWDWRTIGDSGKLVADEVAASWVYAGAISASQITAGTINTDLIRVRSSDGRLEISGSKIHMIGHGSSLDMSPQNGVVYAHEFDIYGRPIKATTISSKGAGLEYYTYSSSSSETPSKTVYQPYVSCVYLDTLGGGVNDPDFYQVVVSGPAWADTSYQPKVMVTPAETLRFVRADGGRLNDLSQYRCTVDRIERFSGGVEIIVESWKTYVSKIVNNYPTYTTGSLRFNIIVIMA